MNQIMIPNGERMDELLTGPLHDAHGLPCVAPRVHGHWQIAQLILHAEVITEAGDRRRVVLQPFLRKAMEAGIPEPRGEQPPLARTRIGVADSPFAEVVEIDPQHIEREVKELFPPRLVAAEIGHLAIKEVLPLLTCRGERLPGSAQGATPATGGLGSILPGPDRKGEAHALFRLDGEFVLEHPATGNFPKPGFSFPRKPDEAVDSLISASALEEMHTLRHGLHLEMILPNNEMTDEKLPPFQSSPLDGDHVHRHIIGHRLAFLPYRLARADEARAHFMRLPLPQIGMQHFGRAAGQGDFEKAVAVLEYLPHLARIEILVVVPRAIPVMQAPEAKAGGVKGHPVVGQLAAVQPR